MSEPTDNPQWVRIAEQFEQSGLTQKQFAQQQGQNMPQSQVKKLSKALLEQLQPLGVKARVA